MACETVLVHSVFGTKYTSLQDRYLRERYDNRYVSQQLVGRK